MKIEKKVSHLFLFFHDFQIIRNNNGMTSLAEYSPACLILIGGGRVGGARVCRRGHLENGVVLRRGC